MTNPGPSRGWSSRRAKAEQRHAEADVEMQAKREARQAMYDAARQRDAQAAIENAKLQARARVSCPCCDGNPVDLDLAARIITAMQRLPAHVVSDPAVVAALNAVVTSGRELDRASIYTTAHDGLRVPHRVYAETPAETRPKVPAAVTPKGKP